MPTPMFYDGQLGPEIRAKLNELGDLFQAGVDGLLSLQGWSPVLSVVADGSREVLRIVDWVGGDGDKPTTLGYVGASGIVADAASAVNVKGGAGNPGPANSLEIGTVVEGPTAAATITGSAPSQVLNLTLPQATDGDDGWSPTFAVATDGARNVLQVVDWVGGSGAKPATGEYVGAAGLVTLIADAVDIRGLKGDEGDSGPANSLSIGTVVSGASASATITGTAPAQELNLVLPKGDNGLNGWSPVLAGATDGERRVLEVVDWVGGQGAKPVNLGYIGVTGIVANIADAVNVRGPVGADGDPGPANSLQIGTVTEGPTAAANISGVPPLQTLDLTLPQATDGADGDDGWSPIFAAVADGERRVLQLIDWTGGTGTKPATGAYVGATGLVALVADATDIRGAEGAGGGGSGDVVGPAASVDNEVALFDGVTGKAIKGGGVLGTGAYTEGDRWKLQAFYVRAITLSAAPTWALGSYYSQSEQIVLNGDKVIRGLNGDVYTMTDGVWVLTDPFDVKSNGSRIAYDQTGDTGPFLWTRTAGVTTRTLMLQGSGNIRYSEGTPGVDFVLYSVRQKLDQIGRLINLTTTDKASIVAAINELVSSKASVSALGTSAALNVPATGDAATGEVVKGDDTRLSDSRPPTGSAGGVLSGSYPNPGFAVDMATQAELDAVSDVANAKLSDAPSDGKTYGRKNAAWAEVVAGDSAQIGDVRASTSLPATGTWLPCDGSVYLQSSYPSLFSEVGLLPNDPGSISVFTSANITGLAQWKAVFYGGGMWVTVTGNGTAEAASSPDGITWTYRPMPSAQQWESIAYGNGAFVAVPRGTAGGTAVAVAARSVDGISWVGTSLPVSGRWSSVSYGNGLFVAIDTSASRSITSPDGSTWTMRATPATLGQVSFVNGMFIATTSNTTATAYKSIDGITWSAFTLPASAYWGMAAYGNNTFILIAGATAATSSDGVVWVQRTLPMAVNSIVYENGTFFAVSNSATSSVLTTADGITWTTRTLPGPAPSAAWAKPGYGDGKFVTVLANAGPTGAVAITYAGITYDRSTQFAVPKLAATYKVISRIKAL